MKVFRIEREQFVPRPLDDVFSFFNRPENLGLITPPSLRFRLLTPATVVMKRGALIDYTIRVLGIPLRWTTLISSYDPPFQFVDEQIKGPYSLWHHTHTFVKVEGGTIIRDEVRYVLPYGFLGRIAHALVVRGRLTEIVEQILGTDETSIDFPTHTASRSSSIEQIRQVR